LISKIPRRNEFKYVLAKDNYFTKPETVSMTREYGIGLVGTFRRQRNWPIKVCKEIDDDRFNTCYYYNERTNLLLMRGIDNSAVDILSTIHHPSEVVVKD
jgi:hypothetical protein